MKTIELKVIQTINSDGTLYSISYLNDKDQLHNENGPAVIVYYKTGKIRKEQYIINYQRHNENGPAIIYYNESGKIEEEHFFLNNKKFTKKDFLNKIKNKKNSCDGKMVEIDGKKFVLTEIK